MLNRDTRNADAEEIALWAKIVQFVLGATPAELLAMGLSGIDVLLDRELPHHPVTLDGVTAADIFRLAEDLERRAWEGAGSPVFPGWTSQDQNGLAVEPAFWLMDWRSWPISS